MARAEAEAAAGREQCSGMQRIVVIAVAPAAVAEGAHSWQKPGQCDSARECRCGKCHRMHQQRTS